MTDSLPLPFFICCLLIVSFALQAWRGRDEAWGIPAILVLATVTGWYVVDVLYNDYGDYVLFIGEESLENAWWQVCLFVTVFGFVANKVSHRFNAPLLGGGSQVLRAIQTRDLDTEASQARLDLFAKSMFVAWLALTCVALIRVNLDFVGLFAPYLGRKAEPWGRARIGGGIDAFLALAGYFQIFLTAGFGVIAALSRNRSIRTLALVVFFLSAPYYIFDRTRNTMLATVVPGFLAWVFLRLEGSFAKKLCLVGLGFVVISLWFAFVLDKRTDRSIAGALFTDGVDVAELAEKKHLGLNMLEELGWINRFILDGTYEPNMGARYFAEIVNPIPRVLWPDKPMIGIDYAIARGQGGGAENQAGVHASISTGMIGQGVVNFGAVGGPIAAALIMACWVALLARQDLLGKRPGRMLLYMIGLILTFNMGRDITLLTLYPFLFGLAMVRFLESRQVSSPQMDEPDFKPELQPPRRPKKVGV